MSEKVDHNFRRKVWIGIMIFLSFFWGGIAYIAMHFF